jgi:hypothetical protein
MVECPKCGNVFSHPSDVTDLAKELLCLKGLSWDQLNNSGGIPYIDAAVFYAEWILKNFERKK